MKNLKETLIELLQENAKYTIEQLSTMTVSNEKAVARAIKEMEDEGVIVKYATIVNTEVLEKKKVQAMIEVKVAPQKLNGFDSYAEEIYSFKEVKSLYLMSGGFDLAVFVEGNDITDIAKFISQKLSIIDGIVSVATHFILKKYKIEGQVTKPPRESERQLIQA